VTCYCKCPKCGDEHISASVSIDDKTAELQEACQREGIRGTLDGRVSEEVAASVLGKAPGTLKNWRQAHRPLKYRRSGGRIQYSLRELAMFLLEGEIVD